MTKNLTLTVEQQTAIADLVNQMHLPAGMGDEDDACSIAAINLALTGELTDNIPDCMSTAIGCWIVVAQDAMPDAMRNSKEWKTLLPFAAGTGREHESERLALIMDWMWGTVLPTLQPLADENGFGGKWTAMCREKTEAAAWAAAWAAWAAKAAQAAWAAKAAQAAEVARAAKAAEVARAAKAAAEVAQAAETATWAAVWAAAARPEAAARAAVWGLFDPCGLLARLIAVSEREE
jgi:primosomal protein N'